MRSNEVSVKTRLREPDTGREAVIDPWQAAAGEQSTEQGGWLLSYLDVMTLLFSFFVMLFAYQKALMVESKTVRAETIVKSAETLGPIANGHPGSAGATPPMSPTVVSVSKATLSDPAVASAPVREDADTRPAAASGLKIQPAYPASLPTSAGALDSEPEPEAAAVDTVATREQAKETQRPAARSGEAFAAVSEYGWLGEPGNIAASTAASISKAVSDANLGGTVEISAASGEVRLEIHDAILFDPASAELKLEGAKVLDRLAAVLGPQNGTVVVEGHTDDRPIATARFRSNWELSAARASTVTRYLIAHGLSPERLRAVGLADTQPREANDTRKGRARNRRVSIVVFLPRGGGVRT